MPIHTQAFKRLIEDSKEFGRNHSQESDKPFNMQHSYCIPVAFVFINIEFLGDIPLLGGNNVDTPMVYSGLRNFLTVGKTME